MKLAKLKSILNLTDKKYDEGILELINNVL